MRRIAAEASVVSSLSASLAAPQHAALDDVFADDGPSLEEIRAAVVGPHDHNPRTQQLSDEELARRGVSLGILTAQRGQGVPLHDRGEPDPGSEDLVQQERRMRAWSQAVRSADVRLRWVLAKTVESVDRLQFELSLIHI